MVLYAGPRNHKFLDTVHTGRQPTATDEEKELALGNVVAAIRGDLIPPRLGLWKRTKLKGVDYYHARPN